MNSSSDKATAPSSRKKAKIDNESLQDLAETALNLYHSHLDVLDEQHDENDTTEPLEALTKLLESNSSIIHPFPNNKPLDSIVDKSDFVGILASVVYYQLTSTAIQEYLDGSSSTRITTPQDLIDKSLFYFPRNAACRAMGANFGRITERLPRETITEWYVQAARDAKTIRSKTLELLDKELNDNSIKEWMELLLLNQIAGVEYVEKKDEENGFFSASSVEGTCRFMAAMLLSRDGRHNDALCHLHSFKLTHRLHPNVWTNAFTASTTTTIPVSKAPVSFQSVLPPKLYDEMCRVFGPDADFWKETNYANQGYFSFLADIVEKPRNLIDDVVMNHLLPLAQQCCSDEESSNKICAYEWWAHSRQASLGHTLHFDTDEAFLEKNDTVHHPLLSSVLHLTGNEQCSGATILLDQTPESELAKVCWRSVPHPNTFMVFPGNLLHGVLPCPVSAVMSVNRNSKQELSDTSTRNRDASSKDGHWIPAPLDTSYRRLTFMVGFKTRHDVPDQRQDKKELYGPCAPLPSNAVSWVKEIQRGYCNEGCYESEPRQEVQMETLPLASPAWECVANSSEVDENASLQIPQGIDHRFFVSGAPECFRQSLFEIDDDD